MTTTDELKLANNLAKSNKASVKKTESLNARAASPLPQNEATARSSLSLKSSSLDGTLGSHLIKGKQENYLASSSNKSLLDDYHKQLISSQSTKSSNINSSSATLSLDSKASSSSLDIFASHDDFDNDDDVALLDYFEDGEDKGKGEDVSEYADSHEHQALNREGNQGKYEHELDSYHGSSLGKSLYNPSQVPNLIELLSLDDDEDEVDDKDDGKGSSDFLLSKGEDGLAITNAASDGDEDHSASIKANTSSLFEDNKEDEDDYELLDDEDVELDDVELESESESEAETNTKTKTRTDTLDDYADYEQQAVSSSKVSNEATASDDHEHHDASSFTVTHLETDTSDGNAHHSHSASLNGTTSASEHNALPRARKQVNISPLFADIDEDKERQSLKKDQKAAPTDDKKKSKSNKSDHYADDDDFDDDDDFEDDLEDEDDFEDDDYLEDDDDDYLFDKDDDETDDFDDDLEDDFEDADSDLLDSSKNKKGNSTATLRKAHDRSDLLADETDEDEDDDLEGDFEDEDDLELSSRHKATSQDHDALEDYDADSKALVDRGALSGTSSSSGSTGTSASAGSASPKRKASLSGGSAGSKRKSSLADLAAKRSPDVFEKDALSILLASGSGDAASVDPNKLERLAATLELKELRHKAISGNSDAQIKVGKCYITGEVFLTHYKTVEISPERALRYFKMAEASGNKESYYYIARCLLHGTLIVDEDQINTFDRPVQPQDEAVCREAIDYLQKGAAAHYPEAQALLARCYLSGVCGLPCDQMQAFRLYKVAAAKKYLPAMYELGLCYYSGWGIRAEPELALKLFEKVSRKGFEKGLLAQAIAHIYCEGDAFNKEKGLMLLKKSCNQGNVAALLEMAKLYDEGIVVRASPVMAFRFLKDAADLGSPTASMRVAFCYQQGIGVEVDNALSILYLQQAADGGILSAQEMVGELLLTGTLNKADRPIGAKYMKIAADRGSVTAQYRMGECFENSKGVTKNYTQAFKYYHLASEQGDNKAQFKVGIMYAQGSGVEQNLIRSFEYFKEAAQQDNAQALCNLGLCYMREYGVKKDFTKARECFEKGKDLGASSAEGMLKVLFLLEKQ